MVIYKRQAEGEGVFTIVVASGAATKTEDRLCRMLLTDMYLEWPAIVTGASNLAKIQLMDTRDNIIYDSGNLAATAATDYPVHLQRKLNGVISFVITTDGNTNADETFTVTIEGLPLE